MRRFHAMWMASVVVLVLCHSVARPDEAKKPVPAVVELDYHQLVDTRQYTHAQVSVGELATRLASTQGDEARSAECLLDQFLEPWAAVLSEVLPQVESQTDSLLLTDIGSLFPSGSAQPAWADFVRSRRYYTLSDGRGRVRMFVRQRGDALDGKRAFDQHYGVVRHILNFLLASSESPQLSVEVYAYHNDLHQQHLALRTEPYRLAIDAPLPPPAGKTPLNLEELDSFLQAGYTVEGALLGDGGDLSLIGSVRSQKPTLEGEPTTIADFAVAYRAMVEAAQSGMPYMSLDRGPDVRYAMVQFGGRLQDTRIGLVTLKADERFKTLVTTFDPATGAFLKDLPERIPGFLSTHERMNAAKGRDEGVSSVRFWFYPDNVRIAEEKPSGSFMLTEARFLAGVEKQVGMVAGGRAPIQPPHLQASIDHFNSSYDAYAAQFREIRELDTVARMLALAAWTVHPAGSGFYWDELLSVELPACPTPRRVAQSVLFEVSKPEGRDPVVLRLDVTNRVYEALRGAWSGKETGPEQALRKGQEFGRERLNQLIARTAVKVPNDFNAMATYGGLDLNVWKALEEARPFRQREKAIREGLLSRQAGEIVAIDGEPHSLLRVQAGGAGEEASPPKRPHVAEVPAADGGALAWTRLEGSDRVVVIAADPKTGRRRRHDSAIHADTLRPSRTVYSDQTGRPEECALYENGAAVRYRIRRAQPDSSLFIAERISSERRPAEEDIKYALELLAQGRNPQEVWAALDEGTPVQDIRRLGENRFAVTSLKEFGPEQFETHLLAGGQVDAFAGKEGLSRLNAGIEELLLAHSNQKQAFVKLRQEGGVHRLWINGRTHDIPSGEIEIMANGTSAPTPALDRVFAGEDAPTTAIVYRDVGTTRPQRHGGSYLAGRPGDPIPFAAQLQRRFPNLSVKVDDDPSAAARRASAAVGVTGPDDVVLLHPASRGSLFAWGMLDDAVAAWRKLGLPVVSRLSLSEPAHNVVILAAHNNAELFDLLREQGPALSGKQVMLLTCGERANANLISSFIEEFDPLGVAVFAEPIDSTVLRDVLQHFGKLVTEGPRDSGEFKDIMKLWNRAVRERQEAIMQDPILQDDIDFHHKYDVLGKAVMQVSLLFPQLTEKTNASAIPRRGVAA